MEGEEEPVAGFLCDEIDHGVPDTDDGPQCAKRVRVVCTRHAAGAHNCEVAGSIYAQS